MRYIPDLIPKDIKVLPDYFKGDVYVSSEENGLMLFLQYSISAICFFLVIPDIDHPFEALILCLIGFILLPQGSRWLEKTFRFRLTLKIKIVLSALLITTIVPVNIYYSRVDRQEAYALQLQKEKEVAAKIIADKKEQQRKDSLNFYLQSVARLENSLKLDKAIDTLTYAEKFILNDSEKKEIANTKNHILFLKALSLIKQGKYQSALPQLTDLLSAGYHNTELLYNRALCYAKTGNIQEAVTDLKPLLQSGNTEANMLYEKINPLRKRIIYYVTRCWDGSTSGSTGRGACSHHGGVKNWNEPVYEEYRKY